MSHVLSRCDHALMMHAGILRESETSVLHGYGSSVCPAFLEWIVTL